MPYSQIRLLVWLYSVLLLPIFRLYRVLLPKKTVFRIFYRLFDVDLNKFGYVTAIANIRDKHDRSAPSHHHWKVLKCRMIIFSTASLLASPDLKELQQVHIVFNKCGGEYDKLTSLFMKFSLTQDGGIRTTTPEIFQICFRYTMNARIAPLWNTLGENYLVCNRNFLTARGPQEGINYYLLFDNEQNLLSLELRAVKINLMNTETLFMPGEWIRVLPSLNKAVIADYYESLPRISKFRCFKDLRRHWKNIHGYRLPEEEGSYYSIQFWRGEPLLYPKPCVLRNFPIITPTPKSLEKDIVQNFLNTLNCKMSNVLGMASILHTTEAKDVQAFDSNKLRFPDTQAVSLCTPTQPTKNFSNNC